MQISITFYELISLFLYQSMTRFGGGDLFSGAGKEVTIKIIMIITIIMKTSIIGNSIMKVLHFLIK